MSENNYKRGNLEISGAGRSSGGVFNSVRISGAGKVEGDLDCIDFKVSGAAKIEGNLKAETAKISGSGKISGDLNAKEVKVSGSATIDGDFNSEETNISGSCNIKKGFIGNKFKISGSTDINGNCEVEEFQCAGAFEILGLLNAENIDVRIGGNCRADEIGGKDIKIRLGSYNKGFLMRLFMGSNYNKLECNLIEGDNIYLESTIAKTVRGVNVVIADGCTIDRVEYSESIKVGDKCTVKERVKI